MIRRYAILVFILCLGYVSVFSQIKIGYVNMDTLTRNHLDYSVINPFSVDSISQDFDKNMIDFHKAYNDLKTAYLASDSQDIDSLEMILAKMSIDLQSYELDKSVYFDWIKTQNIDRIRDDIMILIREFGAKNDIVLIIDAKKDPVLYYDSTSIKKVQMINYTDTVLKLMDALNNGSIQQ